MTVYLGGTVCVCVCVSVVCVCMVWCSVYVFACACLVYVCVCVRDYSYYMCACNTNDHQAFLIIHWLPGDNWREVTTPGCCHIYWYSDRHKSNPHTPWNDGCKSPTNPSLNYTHYVTSLTSNCAELSVLVLWSYTEAIVQDCDLCFMRQVTGRGILWGWNPADRLSQWDGCDVLCPWTSTAELTLAPISGEHTYKSQYFTMILVMIASHF